MALNMMADDADKAAAARSFFEKLNAMTLPAYFNWAADIFEGLHVTAHGDKAALVWADIHTGEQKRYTYTELAARGNQWLNALRHAGVEKGDNMVMMVPIAPETWFATYACIKGGLVIVPTATAMTMRELQYRFENYAPDAIVCDAAFTDMMEEAIAATGVAPKIKIVIGQRPGWVSHRELEKEAVHAEAARTKPHDLLFCFFTSGTTGLPKKVGHTAASYPIGHLSTSAMIGNPPWMTGKMRSGSFGHPSFMYDVALVNDAGEPVTVPDEPGHIVVRLDRGALWACLPSRSAARKRWPTSSWTTPTTRATAHHRIRERGSQDHQRQNPPHRTQGERNRPASQRQRPWDQRVLLLGFSGVEFNRSQLGPCGSGGLGQRKKINSLKLRRMCVGLQGAPNESVLEYVPFGATPKTGAKTSKAGD